MNTNEIITSFNEIVRSANEGKVTAENVAKALYSQAAELRSQANMLVTLARQLSDYKPSVKEQDAATGRKTIVLPEGARHPKAPKPGRKPKKHKKTMVPDDQLTPDQLAARNKRRELCRMMQERKKEKALVEKFAETKI